MNSPRKTVDFKKKRQSDQESIDDSESSETAVYHSILPNSLRNMGNGAIAKFIKDLPTCRNKYNNFLKNLNKDSQFDPFRDNFQTKNTEHLH